LEGGLEVALGDLEEGAGAAEVAAVEGVGGVGDSPGEGVEMGFYDGGGFGGLGFLRSDTSEEGLVVGNEGGAALGEGLHGGGARGVEKAHGI
jgi:hypothetical protein